MYSSNMDPWDTSYGPDRRGHNAEYSDYRNEYRNSRSPQEYAEHRDIVDHREKDRRSPEYRSHRRERERDRDRSPRDRRERSREDRDRNYRDRDDRYSSRQRERDSSDRDRERSRRDRDRDRERDRRGKRGDERDRERDDDQSRESLDFEHDHGHTYGSSMEGVHYKSQTPNNTIMIRGLAQHITENDVRQDILNCGLMPKDIRLIRKKDTGASRGFAFVEFNATQEAARWMEMKQVE